MLAIKLLSKRMTLLGAVLAAWLLTLLYMQNTVSNTISDEGVHVLQIQNFLQGNFSVHPYLTTIPGYHLLIAGIMKAIALESVAGMRAINALLGIMAGLAFYLIRRTLDDTDSLRHAALFFFLPFLYPYYFLIYTDVLSLALVLAAMLAALRRRHILAALVLTSAILVRQNNVAWAGFMPMFALWPYLREQRWRSRLGEILRTACPYLLPIGVFLGYWAWNGTISLSKTVAPGHPDLRLHMGNIYFSLFMFFIFFPYEVWQGTKAFSARVAAHPWLLVVPLIIIAGTKLRGSWDNQVNPTYFLHNAVVAAARHGPGRWIFGIIVAVSACSIARTRFSAAQGWLIYPFSAFYLCSSWLIENRYSIIPFALWMALRKPENGKAEYLALAAWLVLAQGFIVGISCGRFML